MNREFSIHLGFEGGEAETLTLDCPMFKREIKVVKAEKTWDGLRGTYIIKATGSSGRS